jgi:hypothetical protein
MAKYVIVRDDDPNFFTSTRTLEKIYEEIFSLNVPINSSVIPCIETGHKLKNASFHGNYIDCEPFIPEKYRDITHQFAVYENRELIEFINNSKDLINVVQHGFSHSPHEFSSINLGDLKRRIALGKQVLQKAFHETPKFFCAPYDLYTSISLSALKRNFCGATYGEMTLRTMLSPKYGVRLPFYMIPSFIEAAYRDSVFSFNDNFLLLGYANETCFNPFENPSSVEKAFVAYAGRHEVIVLALHYWEFFYDKEKNVIGECVNKKALECTLRIIQWLKSINAHFVTVSQFYKKLN